MSDLGCPLCDKPVSGETALQSHLEFAHGIEDPVQWLADLRKPASSRRGLRRRRREEQSERSAPIPVTRPEPPPARPQSPPPPPEPAPLVAEASPPPGPSRPPIDDRPPAPVQDRPVVPPTPPAESPAPRVEPPFSTPAVSRPEVASSPEAMWSSVEADMEALRGSLFTSEERPAVSSIDPLEAGDGDADNSRLGRVVRVLAVIVLVAVAGLAAAGVLGDDDGSTEAGTTTTSSVVGSSTEPTTPPTPDDFRQPFAFDGELVGCTTEGSNAVYEIGFVFSGAMNIVFDDVSYPDRTGDGDRTTTRTIPSGTSRFVDTLTVFDAVGNEHPVHLTPPVFLHGC